MGHLKQVKQISRFTSSLSSVSLHLRENNFQKRLQLCEWAIRKLQDDEVFLSKILSTDEVTFSKNYGAFKRCNIYYWS